MGRRISMSTRKELLRAIRERYAGKGRVEKSRIIDEFVAVTGYHRKHALRLLNQGEPEQCPERVGRRIYDEAVRAALIVVWETADRICGKRLKAALPSFVESMERHGHLDLDKEVRRRLLTVSAATIDRLLAPIRDKAGKRQRRRVASSAIRKQVPVRTFGDWGDPIPGYFEGDLVAHCGGVMAGSFVHSFVLTDIASGGWTDGLPLLVREQGLVTEALDVFRVTLPVPLRGIDTDNDSVFINETLVKYCGKNNIEQTRSRAYRKNDQAWVEQKNGSVVRRLVGYDRLAGVAAAQALARLFDVARLYVNFFQPSFKLRDKIRVGAKVTRRYFPPATPCERLLAHREVSEETKAQLRQRQADLDPVKLIKDLRDAQAELARLTRKGGTEEATQAGSSLESFLAQLPELWRMGESRPTHRQRPQRIRTWRTRADPFEAVWSEARTWLEQEPDITGKALFDRLRKKHPGEFAAGQLRTLQRRVRDWRQAMARQLILISSPEQEPGTRAMPEDSEARATRQSPGRFAPSPHPRPSCRARSEQKQRKKQSRAG